MKTERKIREHEISDIYEISVDWNGWNFLVIYGKHKNGWFIAIPNWNVCTEAGEPKDENYNAAKISQTNMLLDAAPMYLAQAIAEHWEKLDK